MLNIQITKINLNFANNACQSCLLYSNNYYNNIIVHTFCISTTTAGVLILVIILFGVATIAFCSVAVYKCSKGIESMSPSMNT